MESVVLKRSNLQMVKEVALCFLYQEMQEMDIPYMVIHPVFESSLLQMKIDGEIKLVNLCEENSQKQRVISEYEKRINAAETVLEVYCIIRKSYKLAFCKHIWRYLDEKDRGTLLADAWTRSEFPSRDVNVSINEICRMFRTAQKEKLMDGAEFSTYESLPEQIKIYRGEQFGGNRKGLSWTMDRNIAEWFAKRFQKNGYVKSGMAYKDDILAYFNCRNEKEIVISKVHDVSTEPILNALADVFAHP